MRLNTRICIILACVAVVSMTVHADTYYVDASATGLNDGSDWTNAFTRIQNAITAAETEGDTILVAEGVYNENLDMLGKAVRLISTEPTNPVVVAATVINGSQTGPVITCDSGETKDTVIEGFCITNGKAVQGGGVYCLNSAVTITRCIISSNQAYDYSSNQMVPAKAYGGGVYVESGELDIYNTMISNNIATASATGSPCYGYGAGIYAKSSTVTLSACTITGNRAKSFSNPSSLYVSNFAYGGGFYCQTGSLAVTACTITNNFASAYSGAKTAYAYGGAICLTSITGPLFTGCDISGNTATAFTGGTSSCSYGGAIYSTTSGANFVQCSIGYNTSMAASSSNTYGGAIYTVGGSGNLTITDCVLCANSPDHQEGAGFTDGGGNTYTDNDTQVGTILAGDLDEDGDVDMTDLALFAENWMKPGL